MALGLGIDTGGTYTDAVIYDFSDNKIKAVSKTLTKKQDLESCISEALDKLPVDLVKKAEAVSLSTTLATNACVEGRGENARLILIGCDKKVATEYGNEYGLPPSGEIIFLDGGHDRTGNVIDEPDWEYLRDEVSSLDANYNSYAVVEIWGMNNCDFELKTRDIIKEMTGKRIVCGHELTAKLNLFKRAASALLNAQLIPLVSNFMDSIKINLLKRGITAPISIMRGDGSLMSAQFARQKPVETLLCGPAASIEGGLNLTLEENCVVIDMGGTTSDMAIIKNGIPGIADEGAAVGKWRTGTHSILIETTGLGGDSRITFDNDYNIVLGPERVEPLSQAASVWPFINKRTKEILKAGKKYIYPLCEFLYSNAKNISDEVFTDSERKIAELIYQNPMDIMTISDKLDLSMISNETERLEKAGIVTRIGLTPTDLMHVRGDYVKWDRQTALNGANAMALQIGLDLSDFADDVYMRIQERLFLGISKILIEDEDKTLIGKGMSDQLKNILLHGFQKVMNVDITNNKPTAFEASIKTQFSLVGIGAPIHVFLNAVAKAMQTKCIIPKNAAVANAIGAITGKIRSEKKAVVIPHYTSSGISGFTVSSWGKGKHFEVYDEALKYAKLAAKSEALKENAEKGAYDTSVRVTVSEITAKPNATQNGKTTCVTEEKCEDCIGNKDSCQSESCEIMLETTVTAVAAGKPFLWD